MNRIHTVDVGHNKLQELKLVRHFLLYSMILFAVSSLEVFYNLSQLKTLNLKGNPISTEQNIEKV